MSGLGSWLWGTSQLDDAIDKATSELLPAGSEDIALNLEICDQIRSKSVPAKDAMRALKRRLNHKNPNVQNLALSLTDICIKNGGDLFLTEIASREFIDNLVSILKIPALNNDVKNSILRHIQNWSFAFEGKPNLSYVHTTYKTLQSEGFSFPPKDFAVASSAMVDTSQAPEWIDSDLCLRCRTPFTFTNRKHHCRNCGQVFDQQCSSKNMALPHFGITQEVRVCDGCYNKLQKKAEKTSGTKSHRHSQSAHATPSSPTKPRHRSARELADEELQRAIQLSLEESRKSASSTTGNHARPGYVPYDSSLNKWQPSEPPLIDRDTRPSDRKTSVEEEEDPDLKAAIEASLREMNAPKPSAPSAETPVQTPYGHPNGYTNSYMPQESNSATPVPAPSKPVPTYDLDPMETDAILHFTQTVEQAEAQGGSAYLTRNPGVVEMYDRANGLRPKLALGLDDAGKKEQMLTDMHEKLSQAVKLYDQLLTEQIAHPRWRSPVQAQPSTSYQPPQQQQQAYTNGYSQWSPATTSYQPQQPLQSPPVSQHQYTQQYAPIPTQAPAAPSAPTSAPPVSSSPELDRSYAYQQQVQAPVAPSLPPVSIVPQQYGYQVASPPPPAQQVASPPPPASPQLAQHKSLAVAPHQSVASPPRVQAHAQPNGGLARSHTVSVPGRQESYTSQQQIWQQQQQQQQYHQQQQQQQQHQQYLANQLMQAPVAPTNVITQFPAVPTAAPLQEERKEAMLIDL